MTIIAATTGAVTTQVQVRSDGHREIFVSASNLAGAEECDIYAMSGGVWVVVADPATATPVVLTASVPIVRLAGGPTYGILKDGTVSACSVNVDYGARCN